MTLANARWLIDGSPASTFVFGRKASLAVDVSNFPGGELGFKLKRSATTIELQSWSVPAPAVGATPTTIEVPITLNYQWPALEKLPTTFSLYNDCCKAGATRPYPTNASFVSDLVTDDLLYPPLFFAVTEPGQPAVQSAVIKRALPQFVPGNKVELLVDGDKILPKLLAALAGAQHHVHVNWFFFAPDTIGKQVVDALIACRLRGVEVRVLFDIPATATPEPLGQGVNPWTLGTALGALKSVGASLMTSSLLVPPLDNLLTISDPEYRDRLDVQKEYVKNLIATHGPPLAFGLLTVFTPKLEPPDYLEPIAALGSAGIGTPVLLGGCRDHSKLIIVDGAIAFCGGPNCHRYYLYDKPIDPAKDAKAEASAPTTTEKWEKWHDAFARYEGPAVRDAKRYFVERWAVCTGEYLSRTSSDYFPSTANAGSASVKVINNVPGLERDIAGEYLRMFRNSTKKILVENPYVTDDLLATFLAHAAKVRNIPVELFVPEKYLDFSIARDLMKARWDSLRNAGIKLYAYDTHMNHVKVATADGTHSIVSSYNFAKSSAAQLFECGISVQDAAFATEVEQKLFDVDRPVSRLVTTSAAPDWPNVCKGVMPFLDRIV
jgi:phosphatidylserine/phosphatidylglycerophosphate/cardiolipin synthase-like enzyme